MQPKQLTNCNCFYGQYLVIVYASITIAKVDSRRETFSLIGVCTNQFHFLLK